MATKTPMKCLVCDTTQQACSVAVATIGAVADVADITDVSGAQDAPVHFYEEIGTGHAEHLPVMLDAALARAGLSVSELDGVGVTTGPGTFAGVRVGLAAMRGFLVARKMPVYTITGLELMAQTHLAVSRVKSDLPLACVVDARRGQVYMQRFTAGGAALTPPEVLPAAQAAAMLAAQRHVLIGTGATLLADQPDAGADMAGYPKSDVLYPDAVNMLPLIQQGRLPATDNPIPLYLRPPDAALPKQDQRIKRQ
ncbi:MAG: tRNA (adenosine(37)-N6)-threonylcarbamoyltransferase complex dimerization subunit type 1 TsaB [Parvibaculales bacterium]